MSLTFLENIFKRIMVINHFMLPILALKT